MRLFRRRKSARSGDRERLDRRAEEERRRPSLGALRSASARRARATLRQARPGVVAAARAAGSGLRWLIVAILRLAALIERGLVAALGAIAALLAGLLRLAQSTVTLERGRVAVTVAAAACLGYSQFVTYRGVEVGQPQYAGLSGVAPVPQTDRIDAGAAHAWVLLPLAALALAIAVFALLSRRWRAGRIVSLVGVVGIAVSLGIDLPKGLDAGTVSASFAGSKATLTEGFYAQLAASAVLVLCGWLLSLSARGAGGAAARRRRWRRTRGRGAPSVAGGGA